MIGLRLISFLSAGIIPVAVMKSVSAEQKYNPHLVQ